MKHLGQLVDEVAPTILNKIENSAEEIAHVQEGLRRVYFGSAGSARSALQVQISLQQVKRVQPK